MEKQIEVSRESFLQKEVRDDFIVDEQRKKLWKTMLDIFECITSVCERHDIRYFLISGSALGAVRHKGFIPWDDDMDLGMLRDDYNRFIQYARDEIKEPLFLQDGFNDGNHICGLLRIRDSRTTAIIKNDFYKECNNGIYVEIYPFDNVPSNVIKAKVQAFLSHLLYHGLLADYYGPASKMQHVGRGLVRMIGIRRSYQLWQGVCQRYNGRNCRDVDTVALPRWYAEGIYRMPREWVSQKRMVPFEYLTACIPNEAERMLKLQFGDYMALPPKEKRGAEHEHQVYFDPDTPYTFYRNSDTVKKYLDLK